VTFVTSVTRQAVTQMEFYRYYKRTLLLYKFCESFVSSAYLKLHLSHLPVTFYIACSRLSVVREPGIGYFLYLLTVFSLRCSGHKLSKLMNSCFFSYYIKVIPQNFIAHPYCQGVYQGVRRTIFASLARAHERVHIHNVYKVVAFAERLGL